MLPDRVSNPGPLTYESGALPIALRGPATRLSSHASCNVETNERGLRLLEFATFNNLVLTNTLGPHKSSRRRTRQSPDQKHYNQIDYVLEKKGFRSEVNIHRTRSFPGADIGSDHDLVMMTFRVCLKKVRKPNQPRLKQELQNITGKQTKRIQKAVKKAKEDWIGAQCEETETCLNQNNSNRAY